jgi:hypothetical protein
MPASIEKQAKKGRLENAGSFFFASRKGLALSGVTRPEMHVIQEKMLQS